MPLPASPENQSQRRSEQQMLWGWISLIKVAKGVYDNCPEDRRRNTFQIPDFVLTLEKNQWLGDKTGPSFTKSPKMSKGNTCISRS